MAHPTPHPSFPPERWTLRPPGPAVRRHRPARWREAHRAKGHMADPCGCRGGLPCPAQISGPLGGQRRGPSGPTRSSRRSRPISCRRRSSRLRRMRRGSSSWLIGHWPGWVATTGSEPATRTPASTTSTATPSPTRPSASGSASMTRTSPTASRLIKEAVDACAIVPYDEGAGPRYMKYVPFWARAMSRIDRTGDRTPATQAWRGSPQGAGSAPMGGSSGALAQDRLHWAPDKPERIDATVTAGETVESWDLGQHEIEQVFWRARQDSGRRAPTRDPCSSQWRAPRSGKRVASSARSPWR